MRGFLKQIQTRLDMARSAIGPKAPAPDELLGELFHDVQIRRIYPDGMTFVDMIPANKLNNILRRYKEQRHDSDFDLAEFVQKHFSAYASNDKVPAYIAAPEHTVEQHINALWPVLRREVVRNVGSLIGLPRPYMVAGGRFVTQYYWDSYFTMLGLAVNKDWRMVENMTKNCAYLIRKYGFVPNGNRTYFASRSQPPFFTQMVKLLAQHEGKITYVRYLQAMVDEHKFWMKGASNLTKGKQAFARVLRMPDGEILNRYYDNKCTPRPESYKEDVVTAIGAHHRQPSRTYLDLRAAAESGWDFSARWMSDYKNLESIHTTAIAPVDLNCLLVLLEQTIALGYEAKMRNRHAAKYRAMAAKRAEAINKYMWNDKKGFYFDFDFVLAQQTKVVSCAGLFPLYAQIATKDQAKRAGATTRRELLKKGGLMITTVITGQQWDAPNGWAPMQWVAVKGLRAYGMHDLAGDIKRRWILTVKNTYKKQGKLVEKYNVVNPDEPAGGGEHALQDGFGWTNGVMLALLHEDALNLD